MKKVEKLKKVLVVVLFMIPVILASPKARAQGLSIDSPNYTTAIGLRGGDLGGLTFKHFTGGDRAIEAILGVGYGNPRLLSLTVLLEKHTPAFNVSGMRWYYGGGGHVSIVGSRSGYIRRPWFGERYYYEGGAFGLGIDGIVGLEYKIPPIPFAISIDIKPYIEVFSPGGVIMVAGPGTRYKSHFFNAFTKGPN
jgi:hypothetical protein